MTKKRVLLIMLFLFGIIAIKILDTIDRYDISLGDYIRYSIPLTGEEKEFLKREDIYYGIDILNAPFSFIPYDSNQNAGIMVDYFHQLSVTLESTFTSVSYQNFSLASKLKSGEIDAAVLNKSKMNEEVFLFSQPLYYEQGKVLVKGESEAEQAEDVSNMKIAVISGTTAHHEANIYFAKSSNVQLILTKDLDESFFLLGMGEVDAILGDEAKIAYHLNQGIKNNQFKFLDGAIYSEEVCVAVKKEDIIIFNILNKGILELKKNNQYNHIHSKWFGSFIPEVKSSLLEGRSVNVIILLLSVAFVFLLWNRTVSDKVNIKTKELKESRGELRKILDALTDSIIVTDKNGTIHACNASATNLLKMEFCNIIDNNIKSIDKLKKYTNHANENEPFKIENSYFLTVVKEFSGEIDKKLIVIVDYTERYKYETLTRQEAKMIAVGELSAGLAHEIRNPLGLIKSYSYVLRKKAMGELDNHAIDVIVSSVDRINDLIENLLKFSRLYIENDSIVNVDELISSIIYLENEKLGKNNIRLNYNVQVDNKKIKINEDVLKISIINLINNSIDALNETKKNDKKIDIDVVANKDALEIDFRDNGSGIPSHDIDEIFNPFFTTKETGTGLGLYILHSELRRINGSVEVESSIGEWTRFKITIPMERID